VWRFVCKWEATVRQGFPQAEAGMVIGLLGGSFDPAHAGHAHITREALKRFGLDRVWWLVSPGNPLKAEGPAPMATRIAQARSVIDDPRVVITGLEVRLGTRHTAALLDRLTALYPGVHFVWLMGADNLGQIHRWQNWRRIFHAMVIAVFARPAYDVKALAGKAARALSTARVAPQRARSLATFDPPAWTFFPVRHHPASATRLRALRKGVKAGRMAGR
jgi:nicotinate-nucleotide adenylyltransferase